jgi:phenylpropionate dioxygenase-like ring-hydroxylating dioxygenase large terminal subunit
MRRRVVFLHNYWYVAARSKDVGRAPLARRVLGEDIVLYRKEDGGAAALRDRCPHRFAPLSMGELVGDEIRCRYHGFRFNYEGKCVAIPGETAIPPVIRVDTFPVVERHQMVWVWMGDKKAANPSAIPEWPWLDRPDFAHFHFDYAFDVPMMPIVDNLLDLSHVHFLHRLLGADNFIHDSERMEVWREGDGVYFSRKLRKGSRIKPGTYLDVGGAYLLPSICLTTSMLRQEATNEVLPGPMTMVMHCLTPEDENSTRYLPIRSWNVLTRPQDIAALEHQSIVTIGEDKAMLEAQHRVRLRSPGASERLVRSDEAAVDARRLFEEAAKRERDQVTAVHS